MELQFKSQPGTEKFIRRFEKEHLRTEKKILEPEEAKEKIRISLERIQKEIEEDIKREEAFHPSVSPSTLAQINNILSQALQIALEEGVEEAIKFIISTGHPFLIDALHDILIEHFFEVLVKSGKIKEIK